MDACSEPPADSLLHTFADAHRDDSNARCGPAAQGQPASGTHCNNHPTAEQSSSLKQAADSVPGSRLRRVPKSNSSKPAAKAPARLHTQAEQFSLAQLIKSGNRLPLVFGQARASLPKATSKPHRHLPHSSDSNELDPLLQPPSAEQHIETEVAEQYTVTKKVQSAKHSKAGSTSEESPDAARLRLEAAERAAAKEKAEQAARDKAATAELKQQLKAEKAAQRQRDRQAKQAAAAKPTLMAAIATPVASQKAAAKPAAPTSVSSAVAVTPAARNKTTTKPTAAAATVSAASDEAAAQSTSNDIKQDSSTPCGKANNSLIVAQPAIQAARPIGNKRRAAHAATVQPVTEQPEHYQQTVTTLPELVVSLPLKEVIHNRSRYASGVQSVCSIAIACCFCL